jgi:hypothetical protein
LTVGAQSVTVGNEKISFSRVHNLTVQDGNGALMLSANLGLSPAPNTFQIDRTPTGGLTVNTGNNDTVNVGDVNNGLGQIGMLAIQGGTGINLALDDEATQSVAAFIVPVGDGTGVTTFGNSPTFAVTESEVTYTDQVTVTDETVTPNHAVVVQDTMFDTQVAQIRYSNIDQLTITGTTSQPLEFAGVMLDTGATGNTFNISDTAGMPVTIHAGNGADVVTVGAGDDQLQNVGSVTVNGGSSTVLNLDDQANAPLSLKLAGSLGIDAITTNPQYTITDNTVSRSDTLVEQDPNSGVQSTEVISTTVGYSNIATLVINGGQSSAKTTFTVASTAAATPVAINTGPGTNAVTLDDTSDAPGHDVLGNLTVTGEATDVTGNSFTGTFGTATGPRDFTGTVTLANFGAAALDVAGNFYGSFLAPTVGTLAAPMDHIGIGGSMEANSRIKVNYLGPLTVGGDLDGTVSGYGPVPDAQHFTIGAVTVNGTWGGSGSIVAPSIQSINMGPASNFAGHAAESMPGADFQSLTLGTVTGTAVIQAGAIVNAVLRGDLVGQLIVSGPLGTLSVGGNLSGSVAAASIGTLSVGQNLTGQVSVTQGMGSVSVGGTVTGTVAATISDASAGDTFVITASGVTLNGTQVFSGTVPNLTVNGPGVNDTFQVQSTAAGSATTINTGTGGAAVTVGNANQSVSGIQGAVTVNGRGANTTLVVDDAGTTTAENYTVTSTSIRRSIIGAGGVYNFNTAAINYYNVGHVAVYVGSARTGLNEGGVFNTLDVVGTEAGTVTDLYGNNAGQTLFAAYPYINAADSSFNPTNQLLGPTHFHAGSTGLDTVGLDDYFDRTPQTYSLTAGRIVDQGFAAITYDGPFYSTGVLTSAVGGGTVNLSSTTSTWNVVAANADDVVTLGSQAPALGGTLANIAGNVTIDTVSPTQSETVVVDDSGDGQGRRVTFNNDAVAWGISGLTPYRIYFGLGSASSIQVHGGAGNTTFAFQSLPPAGVNLALVGGSGSNTLDYSGYTGDTQVNLLLGTATGVAGGISRIENVVGSIGNDLIVGDANANTLIGGTGRNILIGGAGSDTLDASQSSGDNLLIGGTTAYDSNLAALEAIFAEWTRTDLSFHNRFSDLTTGTNDLGVTPLNQVNGVLILLTPTTVHADSSPDTLIGSNRTDPATRQRVHNWFFDDGADVLVNYLSSSDHKTNAL